MQVAGGVVESAQEGRVGAEGLQLGRWHLAEQGQRVVAARLPARRIDRGEQVAGLGMPGPAQIQRELAQGGERFRQRGADGESADGFHGQ